GAGPLGDDGERLVQGLRSEEFHGLTPGSRAVCASRQPGLPRGNGADVRNDEPHEPPVLCFPTNLMTLVKTLLELPGLRLRLHAGGNLLDREVSRIYVTELPDPSRYLSEGE